MRDLIELLNRVFHVIIMLCHEEEDEAATDDFVFSVRTQGEYASEVADLWFSEVDLVMRTEVVLNLILLKSVDLKAMDESSLDELLTNVDDEGYLSMEVQEVMQKQFSIMLLRQFLEDKLKDPLTSEPNEIKIFKK